MPKVIDNLKEQIVEEAKRQLFELGYAKTTIRSIAGAVGIGTGTIYNYYPSKDILISSFMLEDWRACTTAMKAHDTSETVSFFRKISQELRKFVEKYSFLFEDKDAAKSFSDTFHKRHIQLRGVLADIILPACEGAGEDDENRRFLAEHIADSLLSWTMEGIPFEKQQRILRRLLNMNI